MLVCDVGGIGADAVAVEALARLQLLARRRGCRTRLHDASEELLALRDFMGLREILPADQPSSRSGRPKSGKSRSVSRKNVSSTIRPSRTSSTWSAHGS
jgi:hypothetical protein